MAGPTEQQRAEFARLVREDGLDPREALNRVMLKPVGSADWRASHRLVKQTGVEAPEGEVLPDAAADEAFGRGVAQGATMRFGDEAQGVVQAIGNKVMGYHADEQDPPTFAEDYRIERDAARAANERAQKAHGGAYLSGEIGGGIATSPVMGSARTLGGTVLLGAKIGAASGLGSSNADLTQGDIAGATKDTAIGAGVGAGAGALGYGLAKGVGAAGRWALDKIGVRSRVQDAARESAEIVASNAAKPSAIGTSNATVQTNLEKSRALAAEWEAMGEKLPLTPAQASGSRAQALRELRLRQNPATMDEAQKFETSQLETAARIADKYVEGIAANPKLIGDPRVAKQAAQAVSNYAEGLLLKRSAVARPLYQAAEQAGGGVDYAPIRAAFQKEIQDYNLKPNQITGLVGSLYGKLETTGAGGGLSLQELNSVRSKLLSITHGKESLLGNAVPKKTEEAIAGRLLQTIDASFDGAEATASAGAAALWRQANAAWRRGTEAHAEVVTNTIERMLTVADGDAVGSIPRRLLNSEPGQIRSVFEVLAKQSPADAANLRAQMFEEVLVEGGKPTATSAASGAAGIDRVQPGIILRLFSARGYGPKLQAAFHGDSRALLGLSRMGDLMQRVGFGPNIRGSTTQPQIADAFAELGGGALDKLASGNGYTAAALQLVRRHLEAITGNAAVAAEAISTREGIEATNKALNLILDGKTGKPITEAAIRAAASSLSTLGLKGVAEMSADAQQQPDLRQPTQMVEQEGDN